MHPRYIWLKPEHPTFNLNPEISFSLSILNETSAKLFSNKKFLIFFLHNTLIGALMQILVFVLDISAHSGYRVFM